MQAIADWLKTGDYIQGIQLYDQYGSNSFLKTKFKAGPNDYNVKKLREELAALCPVESRESVVESREPVVAPPMTFGPTPDNAKRYLQICNKRDKLYRELNMLMEQKHYLPDGEELKKCAFAILSTHQKVSECWAQIDYYQEHGRFPNDDKPIAKAIEPKREMQLLRQTISKAKSRLKSPGCRDREQTQKLLDDSIAKLAVLVAERKAAK